MFSSWKILNPKHQISPYRACGVVGRAHGNKFKYLNPKFKIFMFWSFGFWYLVLFRVSDLKFRIFQVGSDIICQRKERVQM